MGGNVWEWDEETILGYRGLRGGSWVHDVNKLLATDRSVNVPDLEHLHIGFRVASP